MTACTLVEPAIVTSARSLEIPMVVFVELFIFGLKPDYLTVLGTIVVIACVVVIASYDKIFTKQGKDLLSADN